MSRFSVAARSLVLLVAIAAAPAQQTPQTPSPTPTPTPTVAYTVTDISPPGSDSARGYAINAHGQVVGSASWDGAVERAFQWQADSVERFARRPLGLERYRGCCD